MLQLEREPMTVAALALAFVRQNGENSKTQAWLAKASVVSRSLTDGIDLVQTSLSRDADAGELPRSILAGLAASLADGAQGNAVERENRLPLSRARQEVISFLDQEPTEFMTHVLESWVIGQHVYWSIGRGLGDARGNGKKILRLKVVPEGDGFWKLAPGVSARGNAPSPTPDRLATAMSLMQEAGMFAE